MSIVLGFTNGVVFGIEHMTNPDEDDDTSSWMIVVHLACFKLCFIR